MITGRKYARGRVVEYMCDECGNTYTKLRAQRIGEVHYCCEMCAAMARGSDMPPRMTMSQKIKRDHGQQAG